MKVLANSVVIGLGLTIGWFLGKEPPTKTQQEADTVGVSLIGPRQSKLLPRAIDASLPEHVRLLALAKQEDQTDLASLTASLDTILESNDEQALANMMTHWVALDPMGAFNDCRMLADPSHRGRALKAWASQWALADPDTALAEIEKLASSSDAVMGYYTISAVASALGNSHPDEVMALMGRVGDYYLEGLQAVAEVAPEKAMAIAQAKNDDYTARSILRSWMDRDRSAALGYFSKQDEEV